MDEKRIAELMKTLDLTRDEAIELMLEDDEVDHMTVKQAESDLTPEQKQAIKKMKGGAKATKKVKAVDAYGKTVTKERKADIDKRTLINMLYSTLHSADVPEVTDIDITNPERQIDFKLNGRRFRIVLSAPRK